MKSFKLLFFFVFLVLLLPSLVSASVSQDDLLDGLVSYWKFDETSGSTATDSHGENDGDVTGATWTSSGKINNGLSFGSGDYVRFEDEDLKGLSSFSISLWIKPEILNNNNANIITNWQTTGNQRGYIFSLNQGKPQVLLSGDGTFNSDYTTISSNTISDDKYYHLVMTFSGGTATKIYVDGVLDGENTANVPNSVFSSNEPVQINGRQTQDYVNGNIDEIAIWNRALSSDEVSALYDIQKDGLESGSYPFEAEADVNVNDSLRVKDFRTNDFIDSFSVELVSFNETLNYNTTNGTIAIGIDSDDGRLWNITFSSEEANGYFNRTYFDYNFSLNGSLVGVLGQFFVNASNVWTGEGLDSFYISDDFLESNVDVLEVRRNNGFLFNVSLDSDVNTTFFEEDQHNISVVYDHDNRFVDNITGTMICGVSGCSVDNTEYLFLDNVLVFNIEVSQCEGYCQAILSSDDFVGGSQNLFYHSSGGVIRGNLGLDLDFFSDSVSLTFSSVESGRYFDNTISQPLINFSGYTVGLWQSELSFNANSLITESNVEDFNITIGDVTKNSNDVFFISSGTHEVVFSKAGWYNKNFNVSVNPLEVKTSTLEDVYDNKLNITVEEAVTGDPINNFTGWVSNEENNYNQSFSTTTGSLEINLLQGLNYTVYIDATGYALDNNKETILINQTSQQLTFELFETNSIDLVIRDDLTKEIINDRTITFELISDLASYNFTSTDGTFNLTLLMPETYTLRYKADGYRETFFNFQIQNRTYNQQDLYMVLTNASEPVIVTIIDEAAKVVEGALVKLQKYDLSTNTYLTTEIRETDFAGEVIFNVRKNEEFYKFVIERDGVLIRTTNPSYISANTLNIQVFLDETIGGEIISLYGISSTIFYNNETGNFRVDYNDPSNIGSQYCLKIETIGRSINLLDVSCSTSPSGSILIPVDVEENRIYQATFYLNVNPDQNLNQFILDMNEPYDMGNAGLVAQVLMTLLFAFSFMYSPAMGLIMAPLSLLFGRILQINSLPWDVIVPLMIIGGVIAYLIQK